MQRLLIADTAQGFTDAVAKRLRGEFQVETCHDGETAMELIQSFEPDILLLDIMLPGLDGLSILHGIRTSGTDMRVVVTLRTQEPYILGCLERMDVDYVFMKPCAISAVVACIYDLSIKNTGKDASCIEHETDSILLRLGFQMGPTRYKCAYYGVLLWYRMQDGIVTKQLYPEVARICGGSATRVEKAIRDAISDAWKNGNRALWQLYFPPGKGGVSHCPSNEVFIARIAGCLRQGEKLKTPYIKAI